MAAGHSAKRTFDRKSLVGAFTGRAPKLAVIERVTKPRLLFMTGRVGSIFIGVIVLVMALVLILPLPPGGNFPPALACAVLGMGLAQRDGAMVLIGLVRVGGGDDCGVVCDTRVHPVAARTVGLGADDAGFRG